MLPIGTILKTQIVNSEMIMRFCFNPCFIGTILKTLYGIQEEMFMINSFNPCFIGTILKTEAILIGT